MIHFGRRNLGALAYLEASRQPSYGAAATQALENLEREGPLNAIARVNQEYDRYAQMDNQPGDRDHRPDYVEISGSLGITEVALEPLLKGPFGEIRGYSSRFESKTEPGRVEVFSAQHRSAADGAVRISHAELAGGKVRGGTLEQKQDITSYKPLSYHEYFVAQSMDTHASSALFQRLESRAKG